MTTVRPGNGSGKDGTRPPKISPEKERELARRDPRQIHLPLDKKENRPGPVKTQISYGTVGHDPPAHALIGLWDGPHCVPRSEVKNYSVCGKGLCRIVINEPSHNELCRDCAQRLEASLGLKRRFTEQFVALGDMFTDHTLGRQRPFQEANGKQILRDFNEEEFLLQPLLLSKRVRYGKISYHIMSGQHKHWAAIRLYGRDFKVVAYVWENLTDAEEAEIFISTSHINAIRGIDKFKAMVTAGDALSMEVDNVVGQTGWVIGSSGAGKVAAVHTLRRTLVNYNKNVLFLALRTIGEAWDYKEPPQEILIKGFASFYGRFGLTERSIEDLIQRLAGYKAAHIAADIKQYKAEPWKAIATIYDWKRREKNRLLQE